MTATAQPAICYCPGALRELRWATEELLKARQLLQAADPASRAIQETREARVELERAREELRVRQPNDLNVHAQVLLERLEAAMPAADYIRELVDKLEKAEVISWRH